jgi:hypothetical protein
MSEKYPSLDLAYQYVLPSYEWAMRRSDMLEQRLQDAMMLITTVTVAVPIVGKAILAQIDLLSIWSLSAALVYGFAVGAGIWGRAQGSLAIVDPERLLYDRIVLTRDDFRTDALRFAGRHLRHNNKTISRRHSALLLMTGLFAVEVVLIVVWVLS